MAFTWWQQIITKSWKQFGSEGTVGVFLYWNIRLLPNCMHFQGQGMIQGTLTKVERELHAQHQYWTLCCAASYLLHWNTQLPAADSSKASPRVAVPMRWDIRRPSGHSKCCDISSQHFLPEVNHSRKAVRRKNYCFVLNPAHPAVIQMTALMKLRGCAELGTA